MRKAFNVIISLTLLISCGQNRVDTINNTIGYSIEKFDVSVDIPDSTKFKFEVDEGTQFYVEKSVSKGSSLFSKLEKLEVPILLPKESLGLDQSKIASIQILTQNDFQYYAKVPFNYNGSVALAEVFGTSKGIIDNNSDRVDSNTKEYGSLKYTIDYNEEGLELDFSRFGAAYKISLTCELQDALNIEFKEPCQNNDVLLSLFHDLILVYNKQTPK